jgi:RHS repeat-associated protein
MNRQLVQGTFALLVVLFATAVHAGTYYLDSNEDSARTHYRTSQEACVTGEVESRIQGYRSSETNPNVRYRISALVIGDDDGLGEFECRADIERTYANVWVTLALVDTYVYGPFGGTDPCNISGYGDPATGACGSPKCTVGGADCCDVCSNGTNPIHTASGNKYEKETDYIGQGVFPLRFERIYSGNDTYDNLPTPMGIGWSYTYSAHLVAYPSSSGGSIDRVTAFRADGRVLDFSANGSSWQADPDVRERLAATTSGWQITTSDDDVETYDTDGRLTSVTSRGGFVQTLSYVDTNGHPSNPVQRVTDPQGRHLDFTYDGSGRLTQLTEPDGQVVTYTYDAANNLASVAYPAPGGGTVTRTYAYNETGQTSGASLPHALTGLTDESGTRYASWGYTASGRADLSVHGAFSGGTIDRTSLQFNSNGTTTVTDALGQARTFGFAVSFGVARQASLDHACTYCGNAAQAHTWDANGYPASETDFDGNVTQFTYDARGLEEQRVEASGSTQQRTTATTWDSTFHVPLTRTVADAQGMLLSSEAWVYNTRGQPLAHCEIDPANSAAAGYTCAATGTVPAGVRRWVYTYCDAVDTTQCPVVGLLLSDTGPRTDLTQTTTYSYYMTSSAVNCGAPGAACYQPGDLYQVTDALGHVSTIVSYDADSRPTRITDANGVNIDLTYTPRGWLASRSVGGATTTFAYTPYGAISSITDPDGVTTSYTYDAAHRLIRITDAQGNYVQYTLDALGHKTAEQTFDSSGATHRSLSRTYNSLGELTAVVDGLNQTVFDANASGSYDANGNLVLSSDGLGIQRQLGYDALNRLVQTIDNYNGADTATQNTTTHYAYDSLDRLIQVTDPSNLATAYTYDGLSDTIGQVSPDTGSTSRTFDAAGNVLTRTDARGIAATNAYDALDRLTGTTYPDSTQDVAYHYDEANSVTGCGSSYPIGRLTRIVENTVTTVYCYDNQGRVIEKQQIAGTTTDTTGYAYTTAGRLSGIVYPGGTQVSYTRDGDGHIQSLSVTPPGGAASTAASGVTYQPFGPVSGYTLGNGQVIARSYDADYRLTDLSSPAFTLHMARDAMGDITAIGNAAGANPATETYSYDPLYRLTQVTDAGSSTPESVTYNPTGDRLSKSGSGLATGTYSYNLNTHQLVATGNAARTVDADGNTTAISQAGTTYGFGYNDRNRMAVAQLGGSTVASYTYDALGERIGKTAGTSSERYGYDENQQLLSEQGATNRDYVWMDGIPVANVDTTGTTSTVVYVTADQLGTPRAISNSSGTTIWQWAYQGNAWGELAPASTGYNYNLLFPGQYFDAETGAIYNLNRGYDPATGRYLQSDPVGLFGGQASTYAYVDNDPLTWIDVDGLGRGGERGATGGSSGKNTNNPYKHCWEDPSDPNFIICKHHQSGKKVRKPKPADWPGNKQKSEQCDRCNAAKRVVFVGGTAYVIYRCFRMIPSLAPPLWWTIPENLAIP